MTLLELRNINKDYSKKEGLIHTVLSDVNFQIKKGENFTIIGPNGSGKTTLLRILGLLEVPSKGEIFYQGNEITNLTRKEKIKFRRKLSFVRQKPVVLNSSVLKNIAFGLKIRGVNEQEIHRKAKYVIEIAGLNGLENKNARSLSGGEMQRVIIAMNFIIDPEIYLLDEVSANLDPKNITLLEEFINTIRKKDKKTIIMSTHDRLEAIKFADRIGVLSNGVISQLGTPNEIFTSPKDEFTALFVGFENIFMGKAKIDEKSGLNRIKINGITITASSQLEGDVKVCIRPESIGITKEAPKSVSYRNIFDGKIKQIRDLGNICHLIVNCKSEKFLITITTLSRTNLGLKINSEIFFNFKATDVKIL